MTSRLRAAGLTALPQAERIELILSQLTALPTLPAVALRLLEVTTAHDSNAQDVVRIVESDPSLTAAIVRMVRRADLGVRGEVVTVERAVVLLGFSAVRNAVLSLEVFQAFEAASPNPPTAFVRSEFWKHSLAVACAAQLIAEQAKEKSSAGEAFVCGLLHDIGKIALEACLPKSYARVVERVQRERACICDVERELFGFDHTVAGKRLATHWKLPAAILECVWLHHQDPDALPSAVAHPRLIHLIHLADNLVRRERIGFSGYPYLEPLGEQATALGIAEEQLALVVEQLGERMAQYAALVGLEDLDQTAVSAQTLAEANRELGRANAELWQRQRSLEVRSACFDALGRLTRMLSEHNRIADVCGVAADAVRGLLGCGRTVAFALLPATRCVHLGWVESSGNGRMTSLFDLGREQAQDDLDTEKLQSMPEGIGAAPAACETVWQQCFGTEGHEGLWALPMVDAERVIGGVLFVAAEENIRRFQRARSECAALSRAMGLAVSSARTRSELERMNEELFDLNRRLREATEGLVRARSISMVSEMAAGAAHELNNPLAVIAGRAQMLRDACPDEEQARALDIVSKEAVRASQIVLELMEFAKPAPPRPVAQRLSDVLQTLYQYWKTASSLGEGRLTVTLADPDLQIYADREQLSEILHAVVANAVEAADPQSARLHINSPSNTSDDTVRIVVEDNGVGMTREVLEHAIDPFFSSRPAGRGRGLGLSRAYRFAELNGGRLWLESKPTQGTTVSIELPAHPPVDDRPA